jgi:hypothetical protein
LLNASDNGTPTVLGDNSKTDQYLRNSLTTATIESVKPVKVSGFVPADVHVKLEVIAKLYNTTIGHLVAAAVRELAEKPRSMGSLRIDGRSAKAKELKRAK